MNLFSAAVFMLVRSMFTNQVSWEIEEDDKWELTDAIVVNGEQIDLFQQVFTPAMISLCLLQSGKFFDDYTDKQPQAVTIMVVVYLIGQAT